VPSITRGHAAQYARVRMVLVMPGAGRERVRQREREREGARESERARERESERERERARERERDRERKAAPRAVRARARALVPWSHPLSHVTRPKGSGEYERKSSCVNKQQRTTGSPAACPAWVGSRSGWFGIRSPDGLVVGLAPATLEFWVQFQTRGTSGKQGATEH
jgi:hypothetical protein